MKIVIYFFFISRISSWPCLYKLLLNYTMDEDIIYIYIYKTKIKWVQVFFNLQKTIQLYYKNFTILFLNFTLLLVMSSSEML